MYSLSIIDPDWYSVASSSTVQTSTPSSMRQASPLLHATIAAQLTTFARRFGV
jgi:hypothetical protein